MKYVQYLTPFALFLLVFPLAVLAAEKNQGKIRISQPVTVGSTQLSPGGYKVEWEGSGSDVQVKFLRDGKTVATVQAKLQAKEAPSPYDAVILKPSGTDSKTISEINFRNRKEVLDFSSTQTSANN